MPDDNTLTPDPTPAVGITAESEPESSPVVETTTETQPSYEAMQDRLKRLEANAAGSRKEWERERQARERAENEANQYRVWFNQYQMQQQQAATPQPQTAPDEEIAESVYSAVVDGDKRKIADSFRRLREQAKRESQAEMGQYLQAASVQASQSESFRGYLAQSGIAPGNPMFQKVWDRAQELSRNPSYAYTGGHAGWLTSLAVEQVKAESAGAKTQAKEEARQQSVDESFTEGNGGRGAAAPPGKKATSDRMFLTDDEMKFVRYDERKGIKREDSIKRLWNALRPEERRSRMERKHA